MMRHELHQKIGQHLIKYIKVENVRMIIDPACGGQQNIPLFLTDNKSNKTEICNVDLMFIKNNRIKVIVEIEEANIKPTQILGKLMTSALAKFYIHKSNNNEQISMADKVCFIQILDTKTLKEGSSKIVQWKNIEKVINDILPTFKSNIKTYRLFYGNQKNIDLNEISNFVENELKK